MGSDQSAFDDDLLASMLGDFLDESQGYLTQLNDQLLSLDEMARTGEPNVRGAFGVEFLNEMFRAAHSLKGLSAMLQLGDINCLTHSIEHVFDAARRDQLEITADIVDLMFRALDRLSGMVDALRDSSDQKIEFESVVDEISRVLGPAAPPVEIASTGEIDAILSELNSAEPAPSEGAVELGHQPEDEIGPPMAGEAANDEPPVADAGAHRSKPAETLRVDIERLDQLMNLAGQLVINRARIEQIGDQLKSLASRRDVGASLENIRSMIDSIADVTRLRIDHPDSDDRQMSLVTGHLREIHRELNLVDQEIRQAAQARVVMNSLSEAVHQLDRVTDGIQRSVMDTRMVAIEPLFGRFKRVIRDLTRISGKEVRLETSGEQTEFDKRMIDALGDPLNHLVRNAADHGIESPDERRAAGKPVAGMIGLNAFRRGNRLFIQVRDDGRGLVPEAIIDKAVDRGMISASEAQRMTPPQVFQLVWEPGFTTAEQITEVSGRGMGMDIVRSKIEQINGTVSLESRRGEGTTVTIRLPLTLAILSCLMIEVSGTVYAIPIESVVEIVRARPRQLNTVQGAMTAVIRDRVLSVVDLDALFDNAAVPPAIAGPTSEQTLVIVSIDGQEIALAVQKLLGEEDVVIKSLSDNYRDIPGITGASILGNGRVALILDVASLWHMACPRHSSPAVRPPC